MMVRRCCECRKILGIKPGPLGVSDGYCDECVEDLKATMLGDPDGNYILDTHSPPGYI